VPEPRVHRGVSLSRGYAVTIDIKASNLICLDV
jgi:hypothetical protein